MDQFFFPASVKKLYALPDFTDQFLQVPLVDAPITALQTGGLLSEDGEGSIRDSLDKCTDFALHKAHEALVMAIKASATALTVARATIVWLRKIIQLLPPNKECLLEGTNRSLKGASFTTDATLDAISFFPSRSLVTKMAARQTFG